MGKVASGAIHACLLKQMRMEWYGVQPDDWRLDHDHNLQKLRSFVRSTFEGRRLVVSGVRDPVARNLSSFYQRYVTAVRQGWFMTNQAEVNQYKGETCHAGWPPDLRSQTPEEVIEEFKRYPFNHTQLDWYREFFDIVGVRPHLFDPREGWGAFDCGRYDVLLYTVEGLRDTWPDMREYLGIRTKGAPGLPDFNRRVDQNVQDASQYIAVKTALRLSEEELNLLFNNDIIPNFYTPEQMQKFRAAYEPKPEGPDNG